MSLIANNFVKISFNCTQFHPEKMAKEASEELRRAKNAEDGVSKVVVDLFGKSRELKDINNKARSCRTYLERVALPFGTERGSFVIHVSELATATAELTKRIEEFYKLVDDFIMHYDTLRTQGIAKLGNTLPEADKIALYPSAETVRDKFSANYRLYPLPEGVPVGIPSDFIDDIERSMAKQHEEAQRTAADAVLDEVKSMIKSIQNHATKVLNGERTSLDKSIAEAPEHIGKRYTMLDQLGANTSDSLRNALGVLAGFDLTKVKVSQTKAEEALKLTNDILRNIGVVEPKPEQVSAPVIIEVPEPVVAEAEPEQVSAPVIIEVPEPVVAGAEPEPEPVAAEPDKFEKSQAKLKEISDLFSDFKF